MAKVSLANTILGRPLASEEEDQQRLSAASGIPVFGLDALSSAAYGPEAALTILLPLGAAGAFLILPITAAICLLLAIVYLSYRQTIAAYPSGGGSYTVAHENLGAGPGLLAAAALMIDYLLNVAVGISAGVGAIISAIPSLQPHTLSLCLLILLILTLVNLRGTREAGVVFMLPTCLFIGTLFAMIAIGLWASFISGGHPRPVIAPPHAPAVIHVAGLWLLMRAFASGCTAMTGVEAVSNGVPAFRRPSVIAAQRSLGAIIAILMLLLAGIAYLCHAYGIVATPPGTSAYESILSQLLAAVAGKGVFYAVSIISIVLVLCLSANTSFADFPRLCRAVAEDGYLPHAFANRGRRLVYSEGICVLAIFAGILLAAFGGITDNLIPLFAVGAFMAFTLSQAGMVAHWSRQQNSGARYSMIVNGLGTIATLATTIVVAVAKFSDGAWIVIFLVPTIIAIMLAVKHHYGHLERQTAAIEEFEPDGMRSPLVVVPIDRWSRISRRALRFAVTMSDEIQALHVECERHTSSLQRDWHTFVQEPARRANRPVPELVVLKSPYRFIINPLVERILELESANPDRMIAVLLPELVERHWLHYFLHNQRPEMIALRLMRHGKQRIMIVNVPWHLPD
ncbi:MAG TPA: APC family permease [Candidatus Binataceae bacterium]|nr:APC family permease [Candidatus Binataceae bacterium]